MSMDTKKSAYHARGHDNLAGRKMQTPKGRQMRCDISLLVCRWLLERAQGISILHHRGQLERGMLYNKKAT